MQVIALTSHAACHSFLTLRRVVSVAARRSTAERLARAPSIQSMWSGVPSLRGRLAFCMRPSTTSDRRGEKAQCRARPPAWNTYETGRVGLVSTLHAHDAPRLARHAVS